MLRTVQTKYGTLQGVPSGDPRITVFRGGTGGAGGGGGGGAAQCLGSHYSYSTGEEYWRGRTFGGKGGNGGQGGQGSDGFIVIYWKS